MNEENNPSKYQETQDNTPGQDKDLETIRYYHGTWKNFFDYWKKKGVKADPYEGIELTHPTKKVQDKKTLPHQDFGTYDKSKGNKLTESFEQFLNEKQDPKQIHLQTRKTKSIKDSAYPFYVIKDYMGVGYWDRVKESDFRKAFDAVVNFLLQPGSNTERLAKEYNWITDYDELWMYQENKQD